MASGQSIQWKLCRRPDRAAELLQGKMRQKKHRTESQLETRLDTIAQNS